MVSRSHVFLRMAAMVAFVCAAVAGLGSHPAQARVFVGIGVPFYGPTYYPPPVYYPPPAYYPPPPPVYYTPPPPTVYTPAPSAQAGIGQMCYAGSYSCPMDRPVAPGGSCYCLGNGGQRVWGRAN
jgi:hypothetical protein